MKADKHTVLNLLIDNSRMQEFDDMFDFGTVRAMYVCTVLLSVSVCLGQCVSLSLSESISP